MAATLGLKTELQRAADGAGCGGVREEREHQQGSEELVGAARPEVEWWRAEPEEDEPAAGVQVMVAAQAKEARRELLQIMAAKVIIFFKSINCIDLSNLIYSVILILSSLNFFPGNNRKQS